MCMCSPLVHAWNVPEVMVRIDTKPLHHSKSVEAEVVLEVLGHLHDSLFITEEEDVPRIGILCKDWLMIPTKLIGLQENV